MTSRPLMSRATPFWGYSAYSEFPSIEMADKLGKRKKSRLFWNSPGVCLDKQQAKARPSAAILSPHCRDCGWTSPQLNMYRPKLDLLCTAWGARYSTLSQVRLDSHHVQGQANVVRGRGQIWKVVPDARRGSEATERGDGAEGGMCPPSARESRHYEGGGTSLLQTGLDTLTPVSGRQETAAVTHRRAATQVVKKPRPRLGTPHSPGRAATLCGWNGCWSCPRNDTGIIRGKSADGWTVLGRAKWLSTVLLDKAAVPSMN
ncbi:hypothetical protein Bbelb_412450 [Branchiostoma belcheri]|nr:hypothetical protein Bbelb_412450 [Branchiostoma belcheri]